MKKQATTTSINEHSGIKKYEKSAKESFNDGV